MVERGAGSAGVGAAVRELQFLESALFEQLCRRIWRFGPNEREEIGLSDEVRFATHGEASVMMRGLRTVIRDGWEKGFSASEASNSRFEEFVRT